MRNVINRNKLFILGIFLYFIGSSFLWVNIAATRIIQLAAIALFVISYRIKSGENIKYPVSYKILILFTLFCGVFIIIRSNRNDILSIVTKICSADGVLEYLAPLLMFFPLYKYFNNILIITTNVLYVYVLSILITLPMIMIIIRGYNVIYTVSLLYLFLAGSLPFLIIFFNYLSRKQQKIVLIATFMTGLVAVWLGRRGMLLEILLAYLFFLFIWLSKQRNAPIKLIIVSITGMIIYLYLPTLFNLSPFQKITEKGFNDTRTGVEVYLWDDLNQDFNTILYGKGIDGKYFAPHIDATNDDRYSIETGYLHLILKGGVVYLVLMALIFLLPMIKGLFRGRSTISKCATLYLLHGICMMYPGNPFRFMPSFFFMWLCVSLIYRKI